MKTLKTILFFFSLMIIFNQLLAQDTLKVMHYNLLFYGKNVYDCDNNSNNIDEKNEYLKTIIQHVNPDIFSVNELDGEGVYPIEDDASYLLDHALNVDGVSKYRRTDFPTIYLANTLFYNYKKLTLNNHYPLTFNYSGYDKIFNVYQFYFNSEDLAQTNDTIFLNCIVAHLKSSSGSSDQQQRAFETELIMHYLENTEEPGNYLLLADLNLYSHNEDAFQNLINPNNSNYTFNDPADQIGEWHNNDAYKDYHTQSTHTEGDCYSSGGMDDRFDFILASNDIMTGSKKLKYIDSTYNTIGQDGSSFNSKLNTASNSSVPNDVAQALYNMSDHLPVYLELSIDQNATSLYISNVHFQPENPESNEDVSVYADLTDTEDIIKELKVKYGYSSENYSHDVVMEPSGYSFVGVIPKHDANTEIYFKVAGVNDQNEEIISGSEHYYEVSAVTHVDAFDGQDDTLIISNPVKDILEISATSITKQDVLVELISTGGNIKLQKTISMSDNSNHEIPVQHLPAGIYIVKLSGNAGIIHSQKIVIQK
ncbi:MAG: T9SS type A sorting domain-containing protein [Bacteroidales bacterium]